MFGLSAADVEKVRSKPRWRILRHDGADVSPVQHPGVRRLPARTLTLSHVHEFGTRLAEKIGAHEQPYQIRLGTSMQRSVTWTELRTVIPEELYPMRISATGHLLDHPDSGPDGTQWQEAEVTLLGDGPGHLRVSGTGQSRDDQHRYSTTADALATYFGSLGEARRDRSWLIPVLFWLGFAVAVLPILWLIVTGSLHWFTLPFFAATGYVATAYLSEQVGRWSDRSIGSRQASIVDTRPIEEVRREIEAQRQKRRIAWITAAVTGPITAALGAVLAAMLNS